MATIADVTMKVTPLQASLCVVGGELHLRLENPAGQHVWYSPTSSGFVVFDDISSAILEQTFNAKPQK